MTGTRVMETPTASAPGENLAETLGDAGEEAPAGQRHEDGGDVGEILRYLGGDRALAGDHFRVVEGVDERAILFFDYLEGAAHRFGL